MDVFTGLLLMDSIYFHTNIFLNVFRPWTYGTMVVNEVSPSNSGKGGKRRGAGTPRTTP